MIKNIYFFIIEISDVLLYATSYYSCISPVLDYVGHAGTGILYCTKKKE